MPVELNMLVLVRIWKWTWSSQYNEQPKPLKKDLKNTGLTGNWTLTVCDDRLQRSFHWTNQANRRAGLFWVRNIPDGGNEMNWRVHVWNESCFGLRIKIWKWPWSSQWSEQPKVLKKSLKIQAWPGSLGHEFLKPRYDICNGFTYYWLSTRRCVYQNCPTLNI